MLSLLWLIPVFPLAGFLVLALWGSKFSRKTVATIGVTSIAWSTLFSAYAAIAVGRLPATAPAFRLMLWKWMSLGSFTPAIAFYFDPLSVTMSCVVSFVAFLIHLYSVEFMRGDEGYSRYFAYMNLFVAAMLILVLADDLVVLLLGWEGVGLCSYLLIGFWYTDPVNGRAARKAFIVTRVGDTALLIGLFVLFQALGTLQIETLLSRATQTLPGGGTVALLASLLLLGGAVGKSAQLPLQIWLPDAMAGPSPVSALIHAATMVTAGVYLIARMHAIFALAPVAELVVGIVGAATLVISGCSALVTRDFKRALAYSTISQIGYMFLALGVSAWAAAIFHFVTHAFFKSLLFLAAGVVIERLDDEHDIFKMGGLRRSLPLVFWTFLAGSASLSALPLVTAGFYSKDLILKATWSAPNGTWFLVSGLVGSFLTALYSFRLVFTVFFGEEKTAPRGETGTLQAVSLIVLAVLSLIAGFTSFSGAFGHQGSLLTFLNEALPGGGSAPGAFSRDLVLALLPLVGLFTAYWLYVARPRLPDVVLNRFALAKALYRFWFSGWGFDWLYDHLLVMPYLFISRIDKDDFIDSAYDSVAAFVARVHRLLSLTQSGIIRRYVAGLVVGGIAIAAAVVFS